VFFFQIFALDDFVDLLHTVVKRNLVWKIRGEHKRFHSDPFDGVGRGFFVALAAGRRLSTGSGAPHHPFLLFSA
jgi:hypothetical protein